MQKRTSAFVISGAVILAAGLVAVIAAPHIYRSVFATAEVAPPTLRADDTTLEAMSGGPIDPAALTGTWNFVSGSTVGYRVDEELQGAPVTVVGTSTAVEGNAQIDGLTLTEAEVRIDVTTLATDSESRDNYFRETTMRADEYPTATFVLTEPATISAAPGAGEIVKQQLVGELTMAGSTAEVTLTAQVRTDGVRAEIVGKIPVTFADFGITAPSLGGFVTVEETGLIEFDLLAELSQ